MAKRRLRKGLSAPGLLREVRACFEELDDPVRGRRFCLAECLMSGLAVFGLKYPSLLQFDHDARTDELVRENLRRLYGIKRAPCDTALRERLDEVDPRQLRAVFKRVFTLLQRGKGLEGFTCLDGHYVLSVDGTGYFSSSRVHCAQCCEKHHRDGRTTYYHQMLGAVLVHPDKREVFALAPEPIVKGDGAKKNDCERNAAKRFAERRAPRAPASEAVGGGGRVGVERTAHQAPEGAGPAVPVGGEACRPRGAVRVGGGGPSGWGPVR